MNRLNIARVSLAGAALALNSLAAVAADVTLRIDFSIDYYNGRLLDYSRPFGFEYAGQAPASPWSNSGHFLATFSDDAYSAPLDDNGGFSFARATSAQLFLNGVEGTGTTTHSVLAYVNNNASRPQTDYGLSAEFTNHWTDTDGLVHTDLIQFRLDGYSSNNPTISSDAQLASFASLTIDNFNDHLLGFLDTVGPQVKLRTEYLYSANITKVSAVPEPAAGLMGLAGGLALLGAARHRRRD